MGMGFGVQSGSSKSTQGLIPGAREYFSNRSLPLFGDVEKASADAANDPAGLDFLPALNQLIPLGKYGLPVGAEAGVAQLGRDLFGQASSSRALRGGMTPMDLEGVLGDAIRSASGQLIPLSTQTAMQRAQMLPAFRQASFGYKMTPMDMVNKLLSGSGESSAKNFGFNAQISSGAGGSSKAVSALGF